jgi:hypothetical protein
MLPSFKQRHARLEFIDGALHEQFGIVFAFGPTGCCVPTSNSLLATFNDAMPIQRSACVGQNRAYATNPIRAQKIQRLTTQ